MFVDSPEQRRMRVKDSYELALQDWLGTAGFDRPEDEWPRRWAEAYVGFCAGEKRAWLHEQGMRWLPNPGWPERGGYLADGHGNSVPRFHITWGTGPGVVEPFERRVREAVARGLVELRFRHRVDELVDDRRRGHRRGGTVLAPSAVKRGEASDREPAGEFALSAQAVIVTTGGIGGNHELVREKWPQRLGAPPAQMLSGVPAHVDGRMLAIARDAGANEINGDRMWHYVEGIRNWDPIWPMHAIRIIPGPSAMWFDAHGERLPGPLYPGFDTLGTLRHIQGDRPRPHVVRADRRRSSRRSSRSRAPSRTPTRPPRASAPCSRSGSAAARRRPVQAFMDHGEDFIVERSLPQLVRRMNALTGEDLIDHAALEAQIVARDRQIANPYAKDGQVTAIHGARAYLADKVTRVAAPHRILDPKAGPADRRAAVDPHPQVARRSADGPGLARAARVRRAAGRPLRGRRGGRLRRRRHARLPRAGGDVPRRLPVLGADRGPRRGGRHRLGRRTVHPSNGVLTPVCISERGGYWTPCRTSSRSSGSRSRTGSSPGPRSSSWACSSSSSGAR